MSHLELVAIVVEDHDRAIAWFVDVLGFDLVEDSPSLTNDGRSKRWVVVRPPGGQTGILLAQADGESQRAAIGEQFAGRVGFFLRVPDFAATDVCLLPVSNLSRRHVRRHTVRSPSSATSPATSGICWDRSLRQAESATAWTLETP